MRDKFGRFIKGNKAPKTAFKKGLVPWNKGKTGFKGFWTGKKMSKEHRNKLSLAHIGQKAWNKGRKYIEISGSKHPNWKGGRIIVNGYILIKKSNHPFCTKQGYILEHRLVMEKHIGRHLKKSEVVHHINKNILDNRISNLILFPNVSAHIKHHAILRKKSSKI